MCRAILHSPKHGRGVPAKHPLRFDADSYKVLLLPIPGGGAEHPAVLSERLTCYARMLRSTVATFIARADILAAPATVGMRQPVEMRPSQSEQLVGEKKQRPQ